MGFFPDVLVKDSKYDIITFHDVLEHIPDTNSILEACSQHLDKGGVLVVNCPSSTGLIYRISKLLRKVGIKVFFERMWQKDLPSPHLHYFNLRNLAMLANINGFEIILSGRLEAVNRDGLAERISYAGNTSPLARRIVWLGINLMLPLMNVLPSDIVYCVAQKRC